MECEKLLSSFLSARLSRRLRHRVKRVLHRQAVSVILEDTRTVRSTAAVGGAEVFFFPAFHGVVMHRPWIDLKYSLVTRRNCNATSVSVWCTWRLFESSLSRPVTCEGRSPRNLATEWLVGYEALSPFPSLPPWLLKASVCPCPVFCSCLWNGCTDTQSRRCSD